MGFDYSNKPWKVEHDTIKDMELSKCFNDKYRRAKSTMEQRTRNHDLYSRISHMQNIFDHREDIFSEGSTQAIKRKLRQQTIQRVPDGELVTQFKKNSIEQAEIDFLFKNKVLTSEYDGKDMLKNLWRTFSESYDYGFACVRTGFEKDADNDVRISFKLIGWNDILPAPDCKFIEESEWYIERDYISRSDLEALIDEEGYVTDATYEEDTVHYILENYIKSGSEVNSSPLADRRKAVTPVESIETWTLYKRGCDEFKTFVPCVDALLRTVPNYDPRKDVPLHFMILEPDPEFPLGCSCVMFTMAQQQFADAFQTGSYDTLMLALNPPILAYGYTTPPKFKMLPHVVVPMGTNPNAKIEKFPVETGTLQQYGSILQNVSANMMKNMNAADATIASDSNVPNYSGTAQGVQAQQKDRTITVNQYQKRVEIFFSEWANHALRSYLNAMHGEQELTVDEETRKRVLDIQKSDAELDPMTGEPMIPEDEMIVKENKIRIDFDVLSADMLEFKVRTGSLIQSPDEEKRSNIQKLLVPISQMIPALPDEDKKSFTQAIMSLVQTMMELSDVPTSATISGGVDTRMLLDTSKTMIETLMEHQQMLQQIQQVVGQMIAPTGENPGDGMAPEPGEVSAEFPPQAGEPTPMM